MKKRIGIVGGGQLGRMLTFDAKKLGFDVIILDPTPNSPAGQVADEQIVAGFKDEKAIRKLAEKVDYLTFEIELANSKVLSELSKSGKVINPSATTLNIIKDKLKQKEFLKKNNVPVADFQKIDNTKELMEAVNLFGYPVLVKTRFDGYDGRGNALVKTSAGIKKALEKLGEEDLYVEKFVPFIKELAVVVARSRKGQIVSYPVVETIQKNNICHLVFAPARVDKKISDKARKLAEKVMENLKGAGVFGIEMFLTKKGEVLINEIAPRVHNSGHFSIEGSVTSQFEQHIRAVTGLPLGSTEMVSKAAVMINILGEREGEVDVKNLDKALNIPNVTVHIYGKSQTKKERKMGHITAIDTTHERAYKKVLLARKLISI